MDEQQITPPNLTVPLLFPVEKDGRFSVVPLYANTPWAPLSDAITRTKVKMPLFFCPPEMHIEPLLSLTCRAHRLPVSGGMVYNLPLTIETILLMQHDALVSTAELASILFPVLAKKTPIHNLFRLVFLIGEAPKERIHIIQSCAPHAHIVSAPHPFHATA